MMPAFGKAVEGKEYSRLRSNTSKGLTAWNT